MTLVAILTVRKEAEAKFRAYEGHAAAVMRTHGGRIERTVAVAPDGQPDVFKEVHLVTFPSKEAYAAYRSDPRLAEVAPLRNESIVDTQLLIGEEGPSYA